MDERLKKQLEFVYELDKLKSINRQTYIADGSKHENDAEHSWHLALMCMLLSEHSNQEIDVLKTMFMVLIHDAVEVDAGDTYAYDETGNLSKREREVKAAERIFNILPEEQGKKVRALWDEFEEKETPESKFANALDRLQPIILNHLTDGRAWREHGVKKSQVHNRNKNVGEASKEFGELIDQIINFNVEKGNLIDE
ncbi:MAG: HD domain-containing protein [Lachnospiraceae bacterium]|nr:HD domain-containing protein [Lachnospiraceae bacterium]